MLFGIEPEDPAEEGRIGSPDGDLTGSLASGCVNVTFVLPTPSVYPFALGHRDRAHLAPRCSPVVL